MDIFPQGKVFFYSSNLCKKINLIKVELHRLSEHSHTDAA